MQVSYRTATSRIARRMPLPDSALTEEFRPRPRSVTGHPPIFDAPQTFLDVFRRGGCRSGGPIGRALSTLVEGCWRFRSVTLRSLPAAKRSTARRQANSYAVDEDKLQLAEDHNGSVAVVGFELLFHANAKASLTATYGR